MLKKMTALILIVVMLVTVLPFGADAADATYLSLTKITDSYLEGSGNFTLTNQSRIFVVSTSSTGLPDALQQTAKLISSEFKTQFQKSGFSLPIVYGSKGSALSSDIILNIDSTALLADEGYVLTITSENCTVTAKDVDGLLYGAQMLLRHFIVCEGFTIPACTVQDEPDTKERAVMLDCARKYLTKEWICNFIREMSWMGYNTLELHFSEDGGFRADFWDPNYYKGNFQPENDFSWICGSKVQSWVGDKYANDPDANKYLTTAELVEILNTAKEYHIDVIPSFDSPAHMDYLTWKFEQNYKSNPSYSFKYNGITDPYKASDVNGCINYRGTTGAESPTWPDYTTIAIKQDVAKAFVFQLYSDIADFFKEYAGSTDFSIGADEVNLNYSPNWSYADFPEYVNDLNQMLNAKGYTCRMFNDFIGSTTYNKNGDNKCKYDFDDNIEIMYWNSPFNPNTGKSTEDIWNVNFFWDSSCGDGGRTIYNCIQTNCYYVLRVADKVDKSDSNYGKDARDPSNTNWTFYHSTEEDIYNEWYPADISEHGNHSEDAQDVPNNYLGGGYFLIWNDYASVSTQDQMWNGAPAAGKSSGSTYYLLDRMWSNIIKQWNWDVNSSLSYSDYAALRVQYSIYPGFTDPSQAPSVAPASALSEAPDFASLKKALDKLPTLDQSAYTPESYSAWQTARSSATKVYDNHFSASDEVEAATASVISAFNGLKTIQASIQLRTTVNGLERIIDTIIVDSGSIMQTITTPVGYRFSHVEGDVSAGKLFSGANGIVLMGSVTPSQPAVVYYENTPNLFLLKSLLDSANANASNSTAYKTAVTDAQTFYNENVADPAASVTQADIDAMVTRLLTERTKATFSTAEATSIISVRKTSDYVAKGKSAVLVVTTTPNVTALSIEGVEFKEYVAQATTMANGEVVKVWYLRFLMNEVGDFKYTLSAVGSNGTDSTEVTVTCK